LRLLVPGARRGREGVRRRADHAQRRRAQHRGRRDGRGRDQAQRGAVPLAGAGRRPGGLGGGAGRRDEGDSPEWRWITGQSEQEYNGFGWLESIHPEDRERVERDWRECVRTGKIFDDRYRIRTKGGSYRHDDVRAVPIERDGKIVEWVVASSDVTSQREAEEMRGRLPSNCPPRRCAPRGCSRPPRCAEALTVEQVVEVITEVGRTAIGALHSAVALAGWLAAQGGQRRPQERPRLGGRRAHPAVAERDDQGDRDPASVLVEDPDDLRRQFDGELEIDPERVAASDERSWVGLPLLAASAPLGALRFSFGRPRKIIEEERVFLEALAASARWRSSGPACTSGAHHGGDAAAQPAPRSAAQRARPGAARDVPAVAKNMEIGGDWYDAFRLADQRWRWRSRRDGKG